MTHSFTQDQFGKPMDSIDADDIRSYFSRERDESLSLEYKSFFQHEGDIKHKENGVLRTICSFLNSNGGLLIWGAPKGIKNATGQKVFIGDLSPVEKLYSKDDFINKISNRIKPFAAPIQVCKVEVDPGRYVYLIEVPESETKPHQFDDIYYIRLDGQTKVAPHYIIEALFKQIKYPDLNVFLRLDGFINLEKELNIRSVNIAITCFLINSSKFLHEYEPYYMLTINRGGFINKGKARIDNQLHIYNIPSITALTYNLPLVRREVIHIPIEDYYNWCDKDNSITLSITGGGKISPPKKSTYEIELVNAFNNKDLLLREDVNIKRVMDLMPVSLNQFYHEEWEGSEQERFNSILKYAQAR
ncbi:AlbA family DNA-binding domain-containing protein [Spirosoma oryzicola]|uniref:AlbA family DNA-binding domain-containing protein n=1 Tax=Spirosoma oryzicola TaxID=2898794 RepID=UPI001E46D2C9|nr:ATP-binding protein [Spirosoma oryzicola]UHG90094.1 ATP-binding protein [Spirosoma oryzicola]